MVVMGNQPPKLICCLEEPSAKELLQGILPRLGDRDAVESRVREILEKDFVGPMGPLKNLGIQSLDDILLPGDFDELVDLIVGDMFDGDGMITIR